MILKKSFYTMSHCGCRGWKNRWTDEHVGFYKHDLSFNLEVILCLSILSKHNYKVI